MATREIVGNNGSVIHRLREEIVECFDSIQRVLHSKREYLLSKLAQIEQEYALLNKEVDSAIIQLEQLKDSTMGLLTSNLLQDEPSDITKSINEKIAKLKQSRKQPPHDLKIEFNLDLVKRALDSIDVINPSVKKEESPHSVKKQAICYSDKKLPVVKAGLQGTGKRKINEPSGICFYEKNNNIYVADQSGKIVVLNNEGEFIEELTHIKLQKPWGIYVHNNFIYTTDYSNHLLFKLSLTGDCCVAIGGKGAGVGQFRSPLGIFVENELVYVCDELNQRIQIFNLDLIHRWEFYIDVKPQDAKMHDNLIYILALFHSDILVYSKKGILTNSIAFKDTIDKMYFFAIDNTGNFIFTGEEKDLIFICSPQGELVATLGKGVCYKPQGVTVDAKGRIICVCDTKKDMIQIY